MPLTAKLSKRFYDRFGEEIVNELVDLLSQVDATYRSELRETNELNFARFDAKLEQRLAQSDAKLEQRLAQFEVAFEQKLAQLDAKIDRAITELRAELRTELASGLRSLESAFHRDLREQTRFMVGVMVALWTALVIPIVGLWTR